MRKSTDTKNFGGGISGTRRKRNTKQRRATLEPDLGASRGIDGNETVDMGEFRDEETTENFSCDGGKESEERERKALADAEELVLDYTRLLPKNKRDIVKVRWIRDGVMIIEGMVYKRSAGDQDIVDKFQARNMVTRGDVRVEK